jgi:hypothetical protein
VDIGAPGSNHASVASLTPNLVRIAFWTIAVLSGGVQTWYTRHRIFSDGISYLEIAQQYASGDWHGALNAYWSPLYSWVVAAYLVVVRPGPYWEASSLHVVNLVAFLASCWIFEEFLDELTLARPEGLAGLSAKTVKIVGYVAILHGGLMMVGIGFVSPDMIAYFLTGMGAWLTLRIARSASPGLYFVGLGLTLGLGYLDRTAFAPLGAFSVLTIAVFLFKKWSDAVRFVALCGACFTIVAAPFVVVLTMHRGAFTMGESGKLNYGWEVDGASRSVNWQGEPGDIGTPLHPTRLVLQAPVRVYEFGDPVSGSYPPWHDPSYWYDGIRPHLKIKEQLVVLGMNLRATLLFLATAPAFLIFLLAVVLGRGRGLRVRNWPPVYWALILSAIAGIGMYCLVFIDKRYIAGFFAVLWTTALAGVSIPEGRIGDYADKGAQGAALILLLAMMVWLFPAWKMGVRDAVAGHESEFNVNWVMAQRYDELGLKPGSRIAYVGSAISADWVRIANAKVVAEVPVKWERGKQLLNIVEGHVEDPSRFFRLDDATRERVYSVFRGAGAVIAVTNQIPSGGRQGDWKRLLDPDDPLYPRTSGQLLEQSPGYYRWLNR